VWGRCKGASLLDRDDLKQECFIALVDTVNEWTGDEDHKFAAHATMAMKWRAWDAIRRISWLPLGSTVSDVLKLAADGVPVDEIAGRTGCTTGRVRALLAASKTPESLDALLPNGGDEIHDVVPRSAVRRPTEDAALDAIEDEERAAAVQTAINGLNERYGTLITRYYLDGEPISVLIASDGINRNCVEVALKRARRQLRERLSEWRNEAAISYRGIKAHGDGRRWEARVRVRGELRYLGSYRTAREAAQVYDAAAREAFGDQAVLNFPVSKNLESKRRERVPA
jgi:DNA-directed RNA polymerase specialized sigma24 family protein